ncbi:MAG TPA: DUF2332 family protein, partial [Jatrophihabitans sp.]|nr:DUF2332 family protein [Jatrophihabitans sp.]
VDRFHYSGEGWSYGPASSPLRFPDSVVGEVSPVDFEVISRRGCDLSPIDAGSVGGRLRLTSFVWPHDLHRHERLQAALAVAADFPVVVDEAPAASWLSVVLESSVDDGVLTVVWHSVTRQYWPPSEVSTVSEIIGAAGDRMPIAHIAMESPVFRTNRSDGEAQYRAAEVTVQLMGTDAEPVLLGTVADHGVPVTMA